MRPAYGLFQLPSAKLRMSPQLRQAITLLKLSTPELLQAIQEEWTANPLLDYAAGTAGAEDGMRQQPFGSSRTTTQAAYDPLLGAASIEVTLERYLKEQLSFIPSDELPPPMPNILRFLIGSLDSNGYLAITTPEAAGILNVTLSQIEEALAVLQKLDPPGIGARDLQECLLLQARQMPLPIRHLAAELIRCQLKVIPAVPLPKLAARLRRSPLELQAAIEEIKRLNPRPGARFQTAPTHYLVPEILIEDRGDHLIVDVYPAVWPRLTLSSDYTKLTKAELHKDETGRFLQGKRRSALFFLRCLEQRRVTILKVAQAIAEAQADFFRHGTAGLMPLTLKQIADELGMHESTVSRATTGKYAQTSWGIMELKAFFSSGLRTDLGGAASSASVRAKIKAWILQENHAKPYADQKLAELLGQEGIHISRRTVSKYREELGIPPSTVRKRV